MDVKQASKLLGWSKKYLISFQGILNVCEIVICYASIRLLWDTCRPAYSLSVGGFVGSAQETYFYISTWTCLILSSILLISFTVSHVSCILLERTIIGVMFWLTAFILSFITGLLLFLFVSVPKPVEIFGYSHKLGASILGLINSGLFAISAAKSYRACKSNWSYQLSVADTWRIFCYWAIGWELLYYWIIIISGFCQLSGTLDGYNMNLTSGDIHSVTRHSF